MLARQFTAQNCRGWRKSCCCFGDTETIMWWKRKSQTGGADKEVSIHARLHTGETLQITFAHEGAPQRLRIEGHGEIRLAVRSGVEVTAELVSDGKAARGDESTGSRKGRVRTRVVDSHDL